MKTLEWPVSSPVENTNLDGVWQLDLLTDRGVPTDVAEVLAPGDGPVPIPASVPGNVYDALLDAGLIPDPFVGTNENECRWIGRQDWRYRCQLPAFPVAENHELVFEGLDTVALVSVAGEVIGSSRSTHRRVVLNLGQGAGGATLEVVFDSPYQFTDAMVERVGELPSQFDEPFSLIRKMAANYGWDWGPTVVSSGIWRPASIRSWNRARLEGTRVSAELSDGRGLVRVTGQVRRSGGIEEELTVGVRLGDAAQFATVPPHVSDVELLLWVPDIDLWWPHSMGDQPLYEVEVGLWDSEGRNRDLVHRRVGFRRVDLVTERDAGGLSFGFVVNGVRTFARGWNWIPDDPLVDRVTTDRYRRRLEGLRDTGAEWVRVWGGGVFEDDAFYATCDELGLLVWQDFPFACAAYPETPEFEEDVEAEARDNLTRLMHHPSLALWCGNNENFMGFDDWGWVEALNGRGWGEKYYLEILPRVCAELDPTRAYWPGSPYSGGIDGVRNNDPDHGCSHSWAVWFQKDYASYTEDRPRFVSEFGWQAAPAHRTLSDALPGEVLQVDSPAVTHRQKSRGGMGTLRRGVETHFGDTRDFDEWHYLTRVVQSRAIAAAVGYWRSLWPHCQGAFIWQYNDCWPALSWAAEDSAERRKPMWYTARDHFQQQLLVVQSSDGSPPQASLVNNSDTLWKAVLKARLVDLAGNPLAVNETDVMVPAGTVRTIALEPLIPLAGGPESLLIVDCGGQRRTWASQEDRELTYPLPAYTVTLARTEAGAAVTLEATSLLRDLTLNLDRVSPDLATSTELVTLLPGERHTWNVTGQCELLKDVDWRWPVICSVGDLGSQRRSH